MSKMGYLLQGGVIKKNNKYRTTEQALRSLVRLLADYSYTGMSPQNMYNFIEDFVKENLNTIEDQ